MADLGTVIKEQFGPDTLVSALETEAGSNGVAILRQNQAGRYVVVGLFIQDERVTAETLRQISILEIERSANAGRHDRADLIGVDEAGRRRVAVELKVRHRDPEAFSRRVAELYEAWAMIDNNPAAAIARAYDLPSPRVHSWVREARLRGHLPPAAPRSRKGSVSDDE
jgi:hypothetical protein